MRQQCPIQITFYSQENFYFSCGPIKLYLFYNDYETNYTTYINHARWHRCLRADLLLSV